MSIDVQIAALITALNANTAALEKAAGSVSTGSTEKVETKTTKTTKTEKKEEAPKVTQEEVNAALIKIKDDFGMPEAKKIISEVGGVEKMAGIKPASSRLSTMPPLPSTPNCRLPLKAAMTKVSKPR